MRFGIKKLDEILGEIVNGSVILIEGEGDIPLMFAKEFLKNNVANGHKAFALVSERVERILKEIKGIKILTPNHGFSLQELFTIALAVQDCKEKVGFIDIFQQLLIMHDSDRIYNLLSDICSHIRRKGRVGIITLDKRIVDERTLAMFENEADYVIEIKEVVKKIKIIRGIRVKKSLNMLPSNFYKLHLDESIEISDEITEEQRRK